MPFTIYLHNESFLPNNNKIREAALNAAIHAVNQVRVRINEVLGIRDWAVVL